jgi:hypothetical protein
MSTHPHPPPPPPPAEKTSKNFVLLKIPKVNMKRRKILDFVKK